MTLRTPRDRAVGKSKERSQKSDKKPSSILQQFELSGVQEDPYSRRRIVCETQYLVANLVSISEEEYSEMIQEDAAEVIVIPGFENYPTFKEKKAERLFKDQVFQQKLEDLNILNEKNELLQQIFLISENMRYRVSLTTKEAWTYLNKVDYWSSLALKILISAHLGIHRPNEAYEGTGVLIKGDLKRFSQTTIPMESIFQIKELLSRNPEEYEGIDGYIKLAKESGEVSLGSLYELVRTLGYMMEVDWLRINLPYKTAEALVSKLKTPEARAEYKGIEGYIKLAKESDVQLTTLYALAITADYAEELGWKKIQLPYNTAEALVSKLKAPEAKTEYEGILGYVKLAKEGGEVSLGNLYDLVNALDYAEELGWKRISLPCKTAEAIIVDLTDPQTIKRYRKFQGLNLLIKKYRLREQHKYSLKTIAKGLNLHTELQW